MEAGKVWRDRRTIVGMDEKLLGGEGDEDSDTRQ